MIRKLMVFFCFLNVVSVNGQNWQWATSVYGPDLDQIKSVESDKLGNVYVTGWYQDSLYFNSTTFFVASTSYYDGFIAKYDDQGNFIWARKFGGNRDDAGYNMAIDSAGNVYIAGYSRSTTPLVYDSFSFTGTGNDKTFILKIDGNGNLIWGKLVTAGTSNAYPTGIDVNNNNQLILTGTYAFLDLTIETTVLTHAGAEDIFYAMYSASDGTFHWAKRAYATYYDYSNMAVIDDSGNCYISAITYGGIIIDGVGTLPPGGTSYIGFLFKTDSLGTFQWVKKYSNTMSGGTELDGLEITRNGDLYITGWVGSGFTINLNDTTFSDLGTAKHYLQKVDSDGNSIWTKIFPCSSLSRINGIAVDSADRVFIGGYVSGSVILDNITVSPATSGYSFFLGLIDKDGNVLDGAWGGNKINNYGLDLIGADLSGGIYVGGFFGNTTGDFGWFGADTVISRGSSDGFLAKYNYSDILNCYTNSSFTASGSVVCSGESVSFSNSSTGTGSLLYEWKIDGNIFSTAENTSYAFSSPGMYQIQLLTENAYCFDSSQITVQVLPVSDSVLTPLYTCSNDSIIIFGNYESIPGWYYDTLQSANGCDSILKQEYLHFSQFNQNVNANICQGETYILPDGNTVDSGGIYVSGLISSDGCDSIITTSLSVQIIDTGVTVSGQTLTAVSAGNYQWLNCTGFSPVAGQNGQSFTPVTGGSYAVEITQGTCLDTSACYVVSIAEISEINPAEYILFPNPAREILNIIFNEEISEAELLIYEISGKIIFKNRIQSVSSAEINIKHLPPGVYMVKAVSDDRIQVNLLVKE